MAAQSFMPLYISSWEHLCTAPLFTVHCSEVSLDEVRSAILAVDPAVSPREVTRVLTAMFGVPAQGSEVSLSAVPHSEVVVRLSQLGLQHVRQ